MSHRKTARRGAGAATALALSISLTGCAGFDIGFLAPYLGDDVSLEQLEELGEVLEQFEDFATFADQNHDPGLPGGMNPESSQDGDNDGKTGKSNKSTFSGDQEGAVDGYYGDKIGPPSESSSEGDGSWEKRWETDGVQVTAEYDAETDTTTVTRHWHDGTDK